MPNTTSIFSSANISPRPTFTFFWWLFPIHNDVLLQFKKNNPPTESIEPETSQPLQVREPSELKKNSPRTSSANSNRSTKNSASDDEKPAENEQNDEKIDFKEGIIKSLGVDNAETNENNETRNEQEPTETQQDKESSHSYSDNEDKPELAHSGMDTRKAAIKALESTSDSESEDDRDAKHYNYSDPTLFCEGLHRAAYAKQPEIPKIPNYYRIR